MQTSNAMSYIYNDKGKGYIEQKEGWNWLRLWLIGRVSTNSTVLYHYQL